MKLDPIAVGFFTAGILISIYLYVVVKFSEAIYPALLLIAGASFMALITKPQVEEDITEKHTHLYLMYTAICLGVFIFLGLVVPFVPQAILSVVKGLSMLDSALFLTLMAISEEMFFRGFIVGWLEQRTNFIIAILASAVIFAVYHFAVYSTSTSALLYVFGAGLILAFSVIKTKSLAPTTSAHILNNVITVLGRV
jgi:membrane protease YdiL (CAAX protease family)